MKAFSHLFVASYLFLACNRPSYSDKTEIEKVVFAFQKDFNDGGFKNADQYSTDDWEHINPLGGIDRGRDSVLAKVRAIHQGFLKGRTMQIDSMNVRFITSDVALAVVIHKIDPYVGANGVKHENEKNIKTYVFVKTNGKWLMTLDHNTNVQNSVNGKS